MNAEHARQLARDTLDRWGWPVWELRHRPGQPPLCQLVTMPPEGPGGLVAVRVQVGKRPRGVDGPLYADKRRLASADVLALVDPATEDLWWCYSPAAFWGDLVPAPCPWPTQGPEGPWSACTRRERAQAA